MRNEFLFEEFRYWGQKDNWSMRNKFVLMISMEYSSSIYADKAIDLTVLINELCCHLGPSRLAILQLVLQNLKRVYLAIISSLLW